MPASASACSLVPSDPARPADQGPTAASTSNGQRDGKLRAPPAPRLTGGFAGSICAPASRASRIAGCIGAFAFGLSSRGGSVSAAIGGNSRAPASAILGLASGAACAGAALCPASGCAKKAAAAACNLASSSGETSGAFASGGNSAKPFHGGRSSLQARAHSESSKPARTRALHRCHMPPLAANLPRVAPGMYKQCPTCTRAAHSGDRDLFCDRWSPLYIWACRWHRSSAVKQPVAAPVASMLGVSERSRSTCAKHSEEHG